MVERKAEIVFDPEGDRTIDANPVYSGRKIITEPHGRTGFLRPKPIISCAVDVSGGYIIRPFCTIESEEGLSLTLGMRDVSPEIVLSQKVGLTQGFLPCDMPGIYFGYKTRK